MTINPSDHARAVLQHLGGLAWFDDLPPGPDRYDAIERMARNVASKARCSRAEARKAVNRVIREERKVKK